MNRLHPLRLLLPLLILLLMAGAVLPPLTPTTHAALSETGPSFTAPVRIAASRNGTVYVLDNDHGWKIDKISTSGDLVARWTVRTPGPYPADSGHLAADGHDNLYFMRTVRLGARVVAAITTFAPDGRVLRTLYSQAWLNALGLAAQANGRLSILVPAKTAQDNPTARVLTVGSRGQTLRSWRLDTFHYDTLHALSIAVDDQGWVYVGGLLGSCSRGCQGGGPTILTRRAPSGAKPLYTVIYASAPAPAVPVGLAADNTRHAYTAGNRSISAIDANGKVLATWGTAGCGPGRFRAIAGLAIDGARNLYVLDIGNGNVQKLSPNGRSLGVWGGCPSAVPPTPIMPTATPALH